MKATKRCSKCKRNKSISEFYKNRSTKDGYDGYCKSCKKNLVSNYQKTKKGKAVRRKAIKKYRQTEKGKTTNLKSIKKYRKTVKGKVSQRAGQKRFYALHPNHRKAKSSVNHAIQAGKLPRPDSLQCSCGKSANQYHHHLGYEPKHWLDVVPVCNQCHHKCNGKIV